MYKRNAEDEAKCQRQPEKTRVTLGHIFGLGGVQRFWPRKRKLWTHYFRLIGKEEVR